MTKTELIDQYIYNSEMLCPISCSIRDVVKELRYDKLNYKTQLPEHDLELWYEHRKNGTKDKTLDSSLTILDDGGYGLMMYLPMHSAKWLYQYSNDYRPYERWLEALKKQIKIIVDMQPYKVIEEGDDLMLDVDLFDQLTMPMNGKLWSKWRGARIKVIKQIEDQTGRCILTEAFKYLDEKKQEKIEAERAWREDI